MNPSPRIWSPVPWTRVQPAWCFLESSRVVPEQRVLLSSGEQFVDEHRGQLIDRVTDVGPVLDGLLDKGVVSQGIYDDIMAKATSVAQMRQLYSGALHAAGRGGKEVFYQLLEKHEPYLMKDLKRNK